MLFVANFNSYVNFHYFSDKKEALVKRSETSNIRVMQYTFDDVYKGRAAALYEDFLSQNYDLIVLFNVNEFHRDSIKKLIDRRYSYGFRKKEGMPSGIVVISKFPITSKRRNSFLDERGDIIELNLLVNATSIKLTTLHPPKPNTELNWKRRNLMLETFESIQNNVQNSVPYSLIIAELYTTVWSNHFPEIINGRSCLNSQGLYSSTYLDLSSDILSSLSGISTSHCFFSYRIQVSDLNTTSVESSFNKRLSYRLKLIKE